MVHIRFNIYKGAKDGERERGLREYTIDSRWAMNRNTGSGCIKLLVEN